MVDITGEYKQEIKFNIENEVDDDKILRVEISGSENKLIPISAIDETLDRLKSYLLTIGCKLAIKYYNNGWTDTKSELTKKVLIGIRLNLYKTLQATYSKANYFLLLSDDKTVVVLDKEMPRGNRSYYISFKETGSNNIYSTFEFKYMANLKDEFINFEIHDNHGNKVEWSKLSYCLNKEGIDYGTFNNGFSYMENDFNSQSYVYSKTKKFFDI